MVLMGLLFLALGALSIFSKTQNGVHLPLVIPVVCVLGGAVSIWGHDFGHGRVIVTASRIKTRNFLHRSAGKDEIDSLDIIHVDPLKSEVTTPTLFLRDGKSIVLEPLVWSEQVGSEQSKWTYGQQVKIVHEIRETLGLGGQD